MFREVQPINNCLYFPTANQETLAALVQFFSTSFSSGENVSSMTDLPTVPEQPDIESHQTQALEVSVVKKTIKEQC